MTKSFQKTHVPNKRKKGLVLQLDIQLVKRFRCNSSNSRNRNQRGTSQSWSSAVCSSSCAMPFFDDIGSRLFSSFWNKANKRACKNPVFHIHVRYTCIFFFTLLIPLRIDKFHKHMLLDFLRKQDWDHKPLSSKIVECIIVGRQWIPGRHDVLWATE